MPQQSHDGVESDDRTRPVPPTDEVDDDLVAIRSRIKP